MTNKLGNDIIYVKHSIAEGRDVYISTGYMDYAVWYTDQYSGYWLVTKTSAFEKEHAKSGKPRLAGNIYSGRSRVVTCPEPVSSFGGTCIDR